MSDQNPIHRDRGRRDAGEQPYTDARERYAEHETRIEEHAPFPDTRESGLSEEEQRKLEERAAEDRFEEIGQELSDERDAHEGNDDGN